VNSIVCQIVLYLSPVLGTGEAAPGVLCWVFGPSLQEGHWGAGACPEKSNEAGEGSI